MSSKRLTITNLLQIIQGAGNALVTVGVESIETDGCTAINTGVDLRVVNDWLSVGIDDTRSVVLVVGVNKVAVLICWVIWTLNITITKRILDNCKRRYRFAIALKLTSAFFISCLDSSLDLGYSLCIILRNDQTNRVLWLTTIDRFCFPDVGIRPTSVRTSYNLCCILKFF